ncbi:DUF3429 family protein [Aquisediminimonas profunda]|uniref:DUF3429 family protein n=1 Tax=Aquisediminimonas profunda TaxID=1550733 RepID=UPI001FEA465F|nr:DUF3429 family protein [Aquisediminimonas profunda]
MSEPTNTQQLKTACFLTLIAIVPQLLFLFSTLTDSAALWTAPVAAFAYAASIFSFLGGYWWGVALTTRPQEQAIFVIAVLPALLSFALFLPWIWGWSWPGPQLIFLGIAITASFLVDWRIIGIAVSTPTWILARIIASLGLGSTTILIGAITVASNG